jgi:serine/threonine-protein kinase
VIGRILDQRYEILERLGAGAITQSFKARDRLHNRLVTVKVPHAVFAEDEAFHQALRQGAAEAALLTHPNIARLWGVGEADGGLYLVYEYVRGIHLKERIRRIAPFTLSVAVDFGIAIGEALQHAHAAAIVHGDLRPHNVIVSPEGELKVTDFGMALALSASQQAATANLAKAVHYQAPEQAAGAPVGIPTDIYALGVSLYEMLTGSVPIPGDNPIQVAMRCQTEPPPSAMRVNPGVPRALDGIVLKAMQREVGERYASVGDMLADLRTVRDALRFGRTLTWSPLDRASAPPATQVSAGVEPPRARPASPRPPEQAESRPESGTKGATLKSSPAQDDRVPPALKVALLAVLGVIVVAVVVGLGVFMATFRKPEEKRLPQLVGMKLEDARLAAEKVNVRLVPYEEWNDAEPGTIFKSEVEAGRIVPPGHSVRVWVSKGSRMVWVPQLTNLSKDEAEAALTKAGLTLGTVDRAFSDRVPLDYVISQEPRKGERVPRGTAVNLVMSDGPKETDGAAPSFPGPPEPAPEPSADSAVESTQDFRITIRDGRGARRVRVEYDDADGTHTAFDGIQGEGELVVPAVRVRGTSVTVRVYYDDDPDPATTFKQPIRRRSRE